MKQIKRPGKSRALLSQGRRILVAAELVAQADTDRVEVRVEVVGASIEESSIVAVIVPISVKLRVTILDTGGQVIGEGIFDASTKGPAPLDILKAHARDGVGYAVCEDVIVFEVSKGKAAGRIDQCTIEGDAEPTTERALKTNLRLHLQYRAIREADTAATVKAVAFEIGLDTSNE